MAVMQRFLVRRGTDGKVQPNQVYIWTEALAKRGDMHEVFAESAEAARNADTMPDPKNMTLGQLEQMTKQELLIFARVKFGLNLSAEMTKDKLQDEIKAAWFSIPLTQSDDVNPAKTATRAMATHHDARSAPGA